MSSNVVKTTRRLPVPVQAVAKLLEKSGEPGPPGPPGPPGKDAEPPRGFAFDIIRDDLGAIVRIIATPL